MRRVTGRLFIFLSFVLLPLSGFAYSSNICTGTPTCTEAEVGKFMQGITTECGNLGNCSLEDILLVFANSGNFIVGIAGSLVLFMYVIGGFYMLSSRGDPGKVTTGKKYLTVSTTGLVIVLFAYLAIKTLEVTLRTSTGEGGDFVEVCNESNIGQACGPSKTCWQSETDGTGNILCVPTCGTIFQGGVCADLTEAESLILIPETYSACHVGSGLCPEPESQLCCEPAQ